MMPLDVYQASGFELSQMTEHDLSEIVEIEEACGLSRWGWEGYHTELLSEEAALMLVARATASEQAYQGQRIAGFITARLSIDELHINNVAVRERYRRRRLGSALLSAILERGKQRGARKAFLEVRASNAAAQALYARHGFAAASRRSNYYTQPAEDALVMTVLL
jgi:ribosomal-protein-alanine N-acetyltransferase